MDRSIFALWTFSLIHMKPSVDRKETNRCSRTHQPNGGSPINQAQPPPASCCPSDFASVRYFGLAPTLEPQNTQIRCVLADFSPGKSLIETAHLPGELKRKVDQCIFALWTCPLIHIKPSVDCKEIKPMQARLEAQKVSPAAYQAMLGLEMFVRKQSKLEPRSD